MSRSSAASLLCLTQTDKCMQVLMDCFCLSPQPPAAAKYCPSTLQAQDCVTSVAHNNDNNKYHPESQWKILQAKQVTERCLCNFLQEEIILTNRGLSMSQIGHGRSYPSRTTNMMLEKYLIHRTQPTYLKQIIIHTNTSCWSVSPKFPKLVINRKEPVYTGFKDFEINYGSS